jgi:transcriptional regulator with XRE-family HTH domain
MQAVTRRVDNDREAVLFGEAVRHAREKRGMAQNQLADAAGISGPHLNVLEHGGNIPTLTVIFRLCDALGVTPAELLEEVWRQR